MQKWGNLRICALIVVLGLLSPPLSRAGLTVTVYDNFDDGDFDGWVPTSYWYGWPATAPNVVPSPQGYALQGIGNGYSQDPGLGVYVSFPLALHNVGPLTLEMRARSGPQWPNVSEVLLTHGNDLYRFDDYGEGNQAALFTVLVNNTWPSWADRRYPIDAGTWHDLAWSRDANGWWSLSIDGQEVWQNFIQDNQLTSFDGIGLHPLRNDSEIEWVRFTATVVPVPVPGALVLGGIGCWLVNWLRKRRTL